MIIPNLFTLTEKSGTWGLHKFKDGATVLVSQHSSGDWLNVRPATEREITHFEAYGKKADTPS